MRAPGWATASSAMSSAAPCCCTWWTAPPATWCAPGARCGEELAAYGGGLADKPELIVLNKADAMTPREVSAARAALAKASGQPVMVMSGVAGQGVPEVLRRCRTRIHAARAGMTPVPGPARKRLVVKIGSALVVDRAAPRTAWLAGVAADIAASRRAGTRDRGLLRRHRAGPAHGWT